MRQFLFLYLSGIVGLPAPSNSALHKVDFANYEYPWRVVSGWPDHLEWLSISEPNRVKLVNGRWKMPAEDGLLFNGLTLDEVVRGELISRGRSDAVVVLRYDSGGTQYYYWVYIYSTQGSEAVLRGYFRSGDRSSQGLSRVYIRDGVLVVELYDPEERQGDCCSTGILRNCYRWNGQAFVRVGRVEHDATEFTSRRAVSVFGLPNSEAPPQPGR